MKPDDQDYLLPNRSRLVRLGVKIGIVILLAIIIVGGYYTKVNTFGVDLIDRSLCRRYALCPQ